MTMNINERKLDTEVCHLALLIAKAEFRQYPKIYSPSYQAEDLEHDLICHYFVVKDKVLGADNPLNYATRCLYREKDRIHRENKSKVIYVESEILDGRFEGNNYFELLEGAGKLNYWNDNEKVINTQENSTSNQDRDCTWDKIDSPVGKVEKHEFWDKLESLLSERDYMIILEVKVYRKTEQEVAEKVGISQPAVHKVIQKLSKFKEDFKEYR